MDGTVELTLADLEEAVTEWVKRRLPGHRVHDGELVWRVAHHCTDANMAPPPELTGCSVPVTFPPQFPLPSPINSA